MAYIVKLWIDDIRPAPEGWTWAKSSAEAIEMIDMFTLHRIERISFDHDLGGEDTAIKVVDHIERCVYYNHQRPPLMTVHSANPVGRQNLERAINRIGKGYR